MQEQSVQSAFTAPPEAVAVVLSVRRTLEALDKFLDAHASTSPDGHCFCEKCYDATGLRYNLQMGGSIFEGQFYTIDRTE